MRRKNKQITAMLLTGMMLFQIMAGTVQVFAMDEGQNFRLNLLEQ